MALDDNSPRSGRKNAQEHGGDPRRVRRYPHRQGLARPRDQPHGRGVRHAHAPQGNGRPSPRPTRGSSSSSRGTAGRSTPCARRWRNRSSASRRRSMASYPPAHPAPLRGAPPGFGQSRAQDRRRRPRQHPRQPPPRHGRDQEDSEVRRDHRRPSSPTAKRKCRSSPTSTSPRSTRARREGSGVAEGLSMSAPSPHDFDRHVESQLSKLFGPDDLEILVRRSEGPGLDVNSVDSAVLIRHLPSGRKWMCTDYNTQIRNKVSCLLTLLLDTPRLS